jgi:hypothetical protein
MSHALIFLFNLLAIAKKKKKTNNKEQHLKPTITYMKSSQKTIKIPKKSTKEKLKLS